MTGRETIVIDTDWVTKTPQTTLILYPVRMSFLLPAGKNKKHEILQRYEAELRSPHHQDQAWLVLRFALPEHDFIQEDGTRGYGWVAYDNETLLPSSMRSFNRGVSRNDDFGFCRYGVTMTDGQPHLIAHRRQKGVDKLCLISDPATAQTLYNDNKTLCTPYGGPSGYRLRPAAYF